MKKIIIGTLRERQGGGCYSNGPQPTALALIYLADVIKTGFFLQMSSFLLGPIRPRAVE